MAGDSQIAFANTATTSYLNFSPNNRETKLNLCINKEVLKEKEIRRNTN